MSDIDDAWRRVLAAGERLAAVTLADQFAADAERFARFSARHGDLLLDYSKERVDADAMAALVALAEASGVTGRSGIEHDRRKVATAFRKDHAAERA